MEAWLICDRFPWWLLLSKRLNIHVTRIIVVGSFQLLGRLQELIREMKIPTTRHVATLDDLKLEECPPLVFLDAKFRVDEYQFWKRLVGVKFVLSSHVGSTRQQSWYRSCYKISHERIGGCTTSSATFAMYGRTPLVQKFGKTNHVFPFSVIQDNCKMGKTGMRYATENNLSSRFSREIEVRSGVLDGRGLFGRPLTLLGQKRVRVLFSDNSRVDRPLSTSEQLRCVDFPEDLETKCREADLRSWLETTSFPVKIYQEAIEVFSEIILLGTAQSKRKLEETYPQVYKRPRNDTKLLQVNLPSSVHKSSRPIPESKLDRNIKATKDDKAPVPVEIWNEFLKQGLRHSVSDETLLPALEKLRVLALCRWKRSVLKSFGAWRRSQLSIAPGVWDCARDSIRRMAEATWWEWKEGSAPFFWNWPMEFQSAIRDGVPPWFKMKLKPWKGKQQITRDAVQKAAIAEKLSSVIARGYLEPGKVRSFMSYFAVPKGPTDIRMVYDGTKCGLNECIWVPWFALPTLDSLLRSVEPGTYMADNDFGEMFLNFFLHPSVRQLCGVNTDQYIPPTVDNGVGTFRWSRSAMGLRSSPYNAVMGVAVAREIIFGNHRDPLNVFRWDRIVLNLPGSASYNPSRPWVYKSREDGSIAADLFTYVDDNRPTGPSEIECWKAAQRVSSTLAWLGLQDAGRKRRRPQQTPGSWAGSDVTTENERVCVRVSQEKWERTKEMLVWIESQLDNADNRIEFKRLESIRGSLVYISRTYPVMKPFLKGIHHTLDSWRPNRDQDGWKITPVARDLEHDLADVTPEYMVNDHVQTNAPKQVRMVPRLRDDVKAMLTLTKSEKPVNRVVRHGKIVNVVYGFGDASGEGYGSSILINEKIYWRSGIWHQTIKEESSNFRELKNLVEALRELADKKLLEHCELFLFTDNSTAERAYFRGSSKSRLLFDLVLQLRQLEMQEGCNFYVIHVSGRRMIQSGIDGLSRGDQNAGVLAGNRMELFIPLHHSASSQSSTLLSWTNDWASDINGTAPSVLSPNDWCQAHPHQWTYVWTPPPAAAAAALEFLNESIHKRPFSTHIFLVPRIMTAWWFKIANKASDLVVNIKPGVGDWWNAAQLEPLTLCVVLPLSREKPWKHRRTRRILQVERRLQEMWERREERSRTVLRELLLHARAVSRVSWDLV